MHFYEKNTTPLNHFETVISLYRSYVKCILSPRRNEPAFSERERKCGQTGTTLIRTEKKCRALNFKWGLKTEEISEEGGREDKWGMEGEWIRGDTHSDMERWKTCWERHLVITRLEDSWLIPSPLSTQKIYLSLRLQTSLSSFLSLYERGMERREEDNADLHAS